MPQVHLTKAQLRAHLAKQGASATEVEQPPRKPRSKRTRSAPRKAQDGMQVESGYTTPPVAQEAILGMLDGKRCRWRRCEGWGEWISLCGVGRHSEPVDGEGVNCEECEARISL